MIVGRIRERKHKAKPAVKKSSRRYYRIRSFSLQDQPSRDQRQRISALHLPTDVLVHCLQLLRRAELHVRDPLVTPSSVPRWQVKQVPCSQRLSLPVGVADCD